MNWNSVLWAAIGGGAGGAIGAAFSKLTTNKTLKQIVVIAPMVVLAQIVPKAMAAHPLLPSSHTDRAEAMADDALRKSPALANLLKGKSAAEVSAIMQQESHAGLKRLSFDDLVVWNHSRLLLAEKSPQLCAAFWTGKGLTGALLTSTLNQLQKEEADAFFAVTFRSAIAEAENHPYKEPPADTFSRALSSIEEGMPAADLDRLQHVLNAATGGTSISTDDDSCWTIKVFMVRYARMGRADQEQFLRSLASL